jgi:hypothetical protein
MEQQALKMEWWLFLFGRPVARSYLNCRTDNHPPKKNTINKETKRENVLLMCDGTSFFIFGFIFHVW